MNAGGPAGVAAEVVDLRYHHPDGTPALQGVSLSVAPGEHVALLGPNGAGKSTLLLHLAGLLPERHRYLHAHGAAAGEHRHDHAGHVRIDGVEVTPARVREVRERVGIVFSDPDDQLFGLTVGEDVAYGPRARGWDETRTGAAVRGALAAVRLAGLEARSPHHLSMGEKRRACLAGVLACAPGLLLLDEPSGGLDPRGRRELAELLAGLPATLVVATHDLELARRSCRRAVLLDAGVLVAAGAVGPLLDDEELLARHGLA